MSVYIIVLNMIHFSILMWILLSWNDKRIERRRMLGTESDKLA